MLWAEIHLSILAPILYNELKLKNLAKRTISPGRPVSQR